MRNLLSFVHVCAQLFEMENAEQMNFTRSTNNAGILSQDHNYMGGATQRLRNGIVVRLVSWLKY